MCATYPVRPLAVCLRRHGQHAHALYRIACCLFSVQPVHARSLPADLCALMGCRYPLRYPGLGSRLIPTFFGFEPIWVARTILAFLPLSLWSFPRICPVVSQSQSGAVDVCYTRMIGEILLDPVRHLHDPFYSASSSNAYILYTIL